MTDQRIPGVANSQDINAMFAQMMGTVTGQILPTMMMGLQANPYTMQGFQQINMMAPVVAEAIGQFGAGIPGIGQAVQAVQGRAMFMQGLASMPFPGGTGPMGMGFGRGERESLFQFARQELPQATTTELGQLLQGGAGMGAFQAVRTVQDFKTKFRELLNAVKAVASELGTTLTESMAMMDQMRNQFGAFSPGSQAAMAHRVGTLAYAGGIAPAELMGAMGPLTQGLRVAGGFTTPQAAQSSMEMLGRLGTAAQMGIIGDQQLLEATGYTGGAGMAAFAQSYLPRAAERMGRSGRWSYFTASMLDPSTGGVDPEMLGRLRGGEMGLGEIGREAQHRVGQIGQAEWMLRRKQFAGEVMRQEPMAEAMMIRNIMEQRGITDLENDPKARILAQRLTGAGQEELDILLPMAQNVERIRSAQGIAENQQRRAVTQAQKSAVQTPDWLRNFQGTLQGWGQKIEQEALGLQKKLEDYAYSQAEAALGGYSTFMRSSTQSAVTGPGGSPVLQQLDEAKRIVTQMSMGARPGAGIPARPTAATIGGEANPDALFQLQAQWARSTMQGAGQENLFGGYSRTQFGDVAARFNALPEAEKERQMWLSRRAEQGLIAMKGPAGVLGPRESPWNVEGLKRFGAALNKGFGTGEAGRKGMEAAMGGTDLNPFVSWTDAGKVSIFGAPAEFSLEDLKLSDDQKKSSVKTTAAILQRYLSQEGNLQVLKDNIQAFTYDNYIAGWGTAMAVEAGGAASTSRTIGGMHETLSKTYSYMAEIAKSVGANQQDAQAFARGNIELAGKVLPWVDRINSQFSSNAKMEAFNQKVGSGSTGDRRARFIKEMQARGLSGEDAQLVLQNGTVSALVEKGELAQAIKYTGAGAAAGLFEEAIGAAQYGRDVFGIRSQSLKGLTGEAFTGVREQLGILGNENETDYKRLQGAYHEIMTQGMASGKLGEIIGGLRAAGEEGLAAQLEPGAALMNRGRGGALSRNQMSMISRGLGLTGSKSERISQLQERAKISEEDAKGIVEGRGKGVSTETMAKIAEAIAAPIQKALDDQKKEEESQRADRVGEIKEGMSQALDAIKDKEFKVTVSNWSEMPVAGGETPGTGTTPVGTQNPQPGSTRPAVGGRGQGFAGARGGASR